MITTLQSLGLLLTVIVPGAVATLGYERHVGPIGRDGTDRLVRYVFGTALMAPFSLAVAWAVWTELLHDDTGEPGEYINRLAENSNLSPWWLGVPVAYIVVPWGTGTLAGRLRNRYYRWIVGGPGPKDNSGSTWHWGSDWIATFVTKRRSVTPINMTGWDYLFLDGGPKLVSVRLRDGTWIGGIFGPKSLASPPAAPEKEIVLEARIQLEPDGGIVLDEIGTPLEIGGAVRVLATDVDLIVVSAG